MNEALAVLAFHQVCDPVGGNIALSALIAGVRLYILFLMLAVLRLPAWLSALVAMLSAAVLAALVWRMPVGLDVSATTEGMANGLWPISWIVLNAVFFHNLTIASGDFDVIRRSLTRLTGDRRGPALPLSVFFFALLEGIAAVPAPGALSSVLSALVSMAAVALLLRVWKPKTLWGFAADRAAVPGAVPRFRSVGAAVAQVADPPARIVRAYMMYVILVVVILIGQMGNLPFFSGSPPGNVKNALHTPANITADFKCGQPNYALCPNPWIGPNPTKDAGAFKFPFWRFQWPGSYSGTSAKPKALISQEPPIVTKSTAYPITFTWDFLSAAGSLVLFASIAAFIVMAIRGAPLRLFFTTYGRTLRQLALPIMTIAFILGIAAVMNFSGMTSTLALLMAKAGGVFPFFSAVIGALGVFLTGSDTASNTLFGPMQAHTAQQIVIGGHPLNPILTAGTNSSGRVMGKMISPQNLSVGAAGVNRVGAEGEIFRRTIGYSLILTAAVGIVAMIEVYLIPGIIPTLG